MSMQYAVALLAFAAAVKASPVPQGVTHNISPSAPPPPGCTVNYSGSFGIAVMTITGASTASPSSLTKPASTLPVVTGAPVSIISDGQPQAATSRSKISVSVHAVSQIGDGQIQAVPTQTIVPIHQIEDGQIQQRPSCTWEAWGPVSQISDGQIQNRPTSTAPAASQRGDGQPIVTTKAHPRQAAPTSSLDSPALVACASNSTLSLTLFNGILMDAQDRTGYIASNFQFQFDAPAQSGALFTSGWSVCANGSLALGGSSVFYQCLSGDFYNLYDRWWAPQCEPIHINVLQLVDCP